MPRKNQPKAKRRPKKNKHKHKRTPAAPWEYNRRIHQQIAK